MSGLSRCVAAFAVLGLLLLGCGGDSSPVAVRIGEEPVTAATVARWMSALAPEHRVPDAPSYRRCMVHERLFEPEAASRLLRRECRQEHDALKRRALDLLIASHWLVGQARESGLRIDAAEVSRRLEQGPEVPIQGGLATSADSRLAIAAQLAAAKLEQKLRSEEPRVTSAQVAAAYRREIARYEQAEVRRLYLVEAIPSRAAAVRLREAVLAGKQRMAAVATAGLQTVDESRPGSGLPGERALVSAIFSARPGALSPVLAFNRNWAFFEVVRVLPGYVRPLARVRSEVEARLSMRRARHDLAAFVAAWSAKWKARTDCRPAYVTPSCRQFGGGAGAQLRLDPF